MSIWGKVIGGAAGFVLGGYLGAMMFIALRLGVAPSQGHTGFDKIVTSKDSLVEIGIYNHYLHHKYFEVNYSDGIIPLDKWFGSFHDGSLEADKEMQKRLDTYNLGNKFN